MPSIGIEAGVRSPEAIAGDLVLTGISKQYQAVQALADVDLRIAPGQIHALCGHNGAGKSTLVKVLAGLVGSDAGEIVWGEEALVVSSPQQAQHHGIALVDQERGLVPSLTVAENLLLGRQGEPVLVSRRRMRAQSRELLARVGQAELDPDTPVSALAPGDRKLVEIARALGRRARLLILDEPTATLTESEVATVFAALREVVSDGRVSVVLVTHRLDEVFLLSDWITVLRDGRIVTSVPTGTLTRDRLVSLMVGDATEIRGQVEQRGHSVGPRVTITDLAVPGRLEPFSFELGAGTIVGLAGQVGSGASEVLRALAGLVPGATGGVAVDGQDVDVRTASRAARARVRYVSNDRKSEGLFLTRSVAENLTAVTLSKLGRLGILPVRTRRAAAQRAMDLVGVRSNALAKAVSQLSGGNQQKVLIARYLLIRESGLLLLDEPTQGVDVHGRKQIHELIRVSRDNGNTILLASSELDELLELSDVIVTFLHGRVVSVKPRSDASAERVLAEITHQNQEAEAS